MNMKEIQESSLPEASSASNISSPDDNQSHIGSSTYSNNNVEVDFQEHSMKGDTIQLVGDSSANISLEDGHSLPSESSDLKSVLASETGKTSELVASGVLSIDQVVSESTDMNVHKPAYAAQNSNDVSNGHAVDEDSITSKSPVDGTEEPHSKPVPPAESAATVSKHTKHLSLDNFGSVHVHEEDVAAHVSSPHVRDYPTLPNTAHSGHTISKTRFSLQSSVDSPKDAGKFGFNKGHIDTAAPIESVKQAVSKFGGIVDWKAHRVQTVEKRKVIEHELEKVQSEIPSYKKKCEAAEEAKAKVLNDLDNTKRLVEELKINLEKVQTEERQAKQDAELATLRVEEIEQGIAGEASVAAKAQLEVAKARHDTAISEVKTVKDELEALRKGYDLLVIERDSELRKAEEAVSAAKEAEKTVEDLTNELITARESLESAHSAHLEAEEHRLGQAMAREQDALNWEKEVKQVESDVEELNRKILLAKDLKSRLDDSLSLLKTHKDEFAAYMKSQPEDGIDEDTNLNTHTGIHAAVASARKELEEVKLNLEKSKSEVDCLKETAISLKNELNKEKNELFTIKQREGMASVAVSSLGTEFERLNSEIALVQMKVKEARDKMVDLPKQLQEASREADEAKSLAEIAREEVRKAKEEAEQVKAGASTMESKLLAAKKEIEAAKASEKLALGALKALKESESARFTNDDDSPTGVTLTLEEYYKLSKQAHDAEEEANIRITKAMSQINIAKQSELRNSNKLETLVQEMAESKAALEIAFEKAEKAKEGKLGIEQELRKWRADHEQRRKAVEPLVKASDSMKKEPEKLDRTRDSDMQYQGPSPITHSQNNTETESSPEVKVTKKKKKALFPRIFMFLGRKKSHSKS